jgi:hypothetical protein
MNYEGMTTKGKSNRVMHCDELVSMLAWLEPDRATMNYRHPDELPEVGNIIEAGKNKYIIKEKTHKVVLERKVK